MNKIYLTKQNKKTTDFVRLEAVGNLLYISSGKVGKTGVANITRGCGTFENATAELERTAAQYLSNGYIKTELVSKDIRETIAFDKAKWHLGGDYPKELNDYQAYVHTGLFINWIIDNDLLSETVLQEYPKEVKKVREKLMTGTRFYFEYLDGVFSSDELNEAGADFASNYYDFEKGLYLQDYENALADELPSLYHVEDNWGNYELIRKHIDQRFNEWSSKIKNNTTQQGI